MKAGTELPTEVEKVSGIRIYVAFRGQGYVLGFRIQWLRVECLA